MKVTRKKLSPRKWELHSDYEYIIIMLKRKNHDRLYCQVCGSPFGLDLHHIKMRSSVNEDTVINSKEEISYYRNSWRNLILICHECHLQKIHKHPEWSRRKGFIE